MTKTANPFQMIEKMNAKLSGRSLIVASGRYLDTLRESDEPIRWQESTTLLALPADGELSSGMLSDVRVLVLEVDPGSEGSLRRLATVRALFPSVSIIVALLNANVSLVRTLIRQGVTDVAELPFAPDNLAAQILDALSSQHEIAENGNLASVTAIVQAHGGSGATTVLTHLAQAIANRTPGSHSVCLMDFDLQGGDAASYLGVSPKVAMDALIDAGSRLDADLFRSAVTETRYGFSLVAAPEVIRPIDKLDTDHLLASLRLARSMFEYVLVDLPPVWSDWSLSLLRESDRVILISDLSIAALRQTKRKLALFDEIDIPRSRVDIVLNRMERKLFRSVSESDVADTLGRPITKTLSEEKAQIGASQDEGRLVTESGSRSRFVSDIDALAKDLLRGGA
ncbi:P-loop NTPase [Tsuneonella sp. YG55]|uniref:P-loop NTPase n=1 Tax=Tsuneonella litorea TaxID=2976475 RepID=A0A9X2W1V2_9SPHN|nr:P-loop NTPase [Tsuneonella litorea]MCT2559385.1 P-loop NTPase [Tsuneonella litorea]